MWHCSGCSAGHVWFTGLGMFIKGHVQPHPPAPSSPSPQGCLGLFIPQCVLLPMVGIGQEKHLELVQLGVFCKLPECALNSAVKFINQDITQYESPCKLLRDSLISIWPFSHKPLPFFLLHCHLHPYESL